MASNQATLSKADAPLSFMQHLSLSVSYFSPPAGSLAADAAGRNPDLILLLSWMGARDVHMAKYVAQHRALFPSSRILLVRSPPAHMFWLALARKHMVPAILILKGLLAKPELGETSSSAEKAEQGEGDPRVLVHCFSNGGASSAVQIHENLQSELRRSAGNGKQGLFPSYALVMDSCPGNFRWTSTHGALMQCLPRWASLPMHLVIATAWLLYALRLARPAQNCNAESLRGKRLLPLETRRTYMYSKADTIIDWRDVEGDAEKAGEHGFRVRMERFENAGHVSLARGEGERYWRVVRETWDGHG